MSVKKKDERMIDVLSIMSNKLIELDYVKDDFLMNVLEREELSSTAFSFFAIPHSINMDAKRTTIAFYLNKNGIEWDGKKS